MAIIAPPRVVAIAALTLAAAVSLRSSTADAYHLYIAFDPEVSTCKHTVEDFFDCVLGASNFNGLLAPWTSSGSRAVSFRGNHAVSSVVLGSRCAVTQSSGAATISGDAATVRCIERQAHFALANGDILLYYPYGGTLGGRNHHAIPATVGSTSVSIAFAVSFSGTGTPRSVGAARCGYATNFGEHEVFEAASAGYNGAASDDCCNGQPWTTCCNPGSTDSRCRTFTPSAFGFYALTSCDSTRYGAQILPATGEETIRSTWNASSYCHASNLHVDSSALCAQTRAERQAGRCVGASLQTCVIGLATEACGSLGCSPTPVPHCVTPISARCTLDTPDAMCSGTTATATLTCINTGTSSWSSALELGIAPGETSSAFYGASWPSTTIAARVSPTSVAPGATGTFTFQLYAPSVPISTDYDESWQLIEGTTRYPSPTPDQLAMHITVSPCDDGGTILADAAADDAADPDATLDPPSDGDYGQDPDDVDAFTTGDARGAESVTTPPGCGCRTLPARAPGRHDWTAIAAVLAAAFASLRTARRRSREKSR